MLRPEPIAGVFLTLRRASKSVIRVIFSIMHTFTRRDMFGMIGAAGLVQAAQRPRPNIIYIMADDHAAHAISAYGSRINQTPNIDRIATGGMRMTNTFCTNSICTPSRAAILTVSAFAVCFGTTNRFIVRDESRHRPLA